MSIISKNTKKMQNEYNFLIIKKNVYLPFFYAGIILYPGCERNLHIWFVQKNYISTFLGTFYKICRYSPTCKLSVLKGSLHIFCFDISCKTLKVIPVLEDTQIDTKYFVLWTSLGNSWDKFIRHINTKKNIRVWDMKCWHIMFTTKLKTIKAFLIFGGL